MNATWDVIVVGGGIAGAALAYFLRTDARVLILEREERAGYHSTGRSAAIFTENYGSDIVSALARASRPFLEAPPDGFTAAPLLGPLGCLTLASPGQEAQFERELATAQGRVAAIHRTGAGFALARFPFLRPERIADSYFEPGAQDIDADALHQAYLRGSRHAGGSLVTGADMTEAVRRSGLWEVRTGSGDLYSAPVLVDAAGAWADTVARRAGVQPLGLEPRRRTAVLVPLPEGADARTLPMITTIDETLYARPSSGALMASPFDATPCAPCDAQPEEIDVAVAVDRLIRLTTIPVDRVLHRWAGLRTFHADNLPVMGEDPAHPGFFWLAGQGGAGIKTSPALGQLAAAAILRRGAPGELAKLGVEAAPLRPRR